MKIGMNMHLWATNINRDHFASIEQLKDIGYDGIEIFLAEPAPESYKELGVFLQDIGLEVNGCLGLGPEADPISPDPKIRAQALQTLKTAIDNMHRAGGRNICGPFHSAFAQFSKDQAQEEEYKRSAEVLHQAGEYAQAANITLTPEALNRFECYLCNTMEQLLHLVNLTDHPNVKGMFDPHHANIEEKSFAASIETIAPVLGHVHISENDRGTPGSGHIPWDEVFATLSNIKYEGWLTVEAFSRDDLDFANAINVWREFNTREDICRNGFQFIKQMLKKHF